MQVTVHVRPDTALKLREQQTTPEADEVIQAAKDVGAVLKPMYPDVEDPRLANLFTVEVPDTSTAERVVNRLQNSRAVEAAYLKPPDALP